MAKKNFKKAANKPANSTPVNAQASEEARQQKAQAAQAKEQARKYGMALMKLKPFSRIAVAVLVVALLLFTVSWAYVYNTDIPGTEVSFNGWASAVARITGNYSSMSAIYGDLAVPFYYYAGSYCTTLSTYTLFALLMVVVTLALQIVAMVKKLYNLHAVTAVTSLVSAVLLFVCFFTALSMKDAQILPIYCQGNPACSIRSTAIAPAICMLVAVAVNAFIFLQVYKARKPAK